MLDVTPLARIVGERFRAIRSDSGIPLDRIAAEARQLGLGWGKSSVAALESGARDLSVGELLLLPEVLRRAGAWVYEYADFGEPEGTSRRFKIGRPQAVRLDDLLPDDDRRVLLAGEVHTSARALRALFTDIRDRPLPIEGLTASVGEATVKAALRWWPWASTMVDAIREHRRRIRPHREWHPDHDETFWPDVGREAADDATRKAAAALKVPPLAVALAARACWNGVRGLTDEREHRLEALAMTGDHGRRELQALRGHITRKLLAELRPLVADFTHKKSKMRRRTR